MTVFLWFSATVQSRSCSTSGSFIKKPKLEPRQNWISWIQIQIKSTENQNLKTQTRSALGHTAVPFPPWFRQTRHLVRCLPLFFPSFFFSSQVLMGAVVLQAGQYGCVKHFLEILLGQRGALHVGHSSNLHRTALGVQWFYGLLPVLIQVNENLKPGGNTVL